MSGAKFGTDGIRGVANSDLTPELALALGLAAGRELVSRGGTPRVVLGRDTRRSGDMLESALAAGFTSAGVDVVQMGVAPTPAVAFVTRMLGFGLGAVISASHNPAPDNGIKLFGSEGAKLPDDMEAAIERGMTEAFPDRPTGSRIGRIVVDPSGAEVYLKHLEKVLPEGLNGLKVAVDCANGAAFYLGPEVLTRLGATVLEVNTDPDGDNINVGGGATHPEGICEFTEGMGADVGVAFDGDADRAVFSDSEGNLVNGDLTMAIWAAHHQELGELSPATIVGTVMSNGGFANYLDNRGIKLLRTQVGDKYVSRELEASGSLIGGEQSGHIIFPKHAPSGDGLLTMLELFRVLTRSGKSLAEWAKAYEPWPQVLLNLTVDKPKEWDSNKAVRDTVEEVTAAIGVKGRINVRPSGTQPMLRVMVEADSYELRDAAAAQILRAMQAEIGAKVYSQVDLTHALGD